MQNNSNNKIDRFDIGADSIKYIKKSEKLKKLSKSGKSKSEKLAKFKKLSKNRNWFKFHAKETRLSFLTFDIKIIFNRL